MPANDHLDWLDLTDFTPGLWTRDRASMPYNAAQLLQDAVPLQQGGMRPFFDDVTVTTSGLDMSAGNQIIGIGQHIVSGSRDMYLAKYDSSDNEIRIYRMNEVLGASSWTLIADSFDTTGTDSFTQAFFQTFIDAAGDRWMLLALHYGGSGATGPGIYRIAYATGTVTLIQQARPTGLIVNQGRWMYAQYDTSQLIYSEVGSIEPTFNYLDVTPSGPGADITALASQEPSDILVGKNGGAWVSIQGDISSPNTVVRELAGFRSAGPRPVRPAPAPGGLVFVDGLGSVYMTDGRNVQDLGANIFSPTAARVASLGGQDGVVGQVGYINDFLFVPGGLVRDMRTGAWFNIVQPDFDNKDLWLPDHASNTIWGASLDDVGDATMSRYFAFESSQPGTSRAPQCAWTSAPITTKDGGDARIREVQIIAQTGAATANDFNVTRFDSNGGNSVVRSVLNTGANDIQRHRFLFPNSGDGAQWVKVEWNTSAEDTEAATIRRIRIGIAPARGVGLS
jgi:hypothetical protein